jgi:membrane glycosyltransferase
MPKFLVGLDAILTGRAKGFGGARQSLRSVLAELALSSLFAPVLLAFQTRSVLQVLLGRDGGWPTNNRGDGSLSGAESWTAARWISLWGFGVLAATQYIAPELTLWLLPVALPLAIAPFLIWWTSRASKGRYFRVPAEQSRPAILAANDAILASWSDQKAGQVSA